jgi:hypothetical protein
VGSEKIGEKEEGGMTCDHRVKNITGVYENKGGPVAVGWDCPICRTSGAILWAKASEPQRAEAILVEQARRYQLGMATA